MRSNRTKLLPRGMVSGRSSMGPAPRFSREQTAYMMARAAYDVDYQRSRDYDKQMDAECQRLGIPNSIDRPDVYVGMLPEGHPMWAEGQRLLDREEASRKLMYAAAHNLFDWATEITLAKCGTPAQKASIRQMVATVKPMAWVESPWQKLVDLSMHLDAAA